MSDEEESKEQPVDNSEYIDLRRLVKQEGLLEKSPAYYMIKIPMALAMLGCSLAVLMLVDDFRYQLLNAALLAFATSGLLRTR